MLTFGLDYIWYHNQRQEELLAEANRQHLVQEALNIRQARIHKPSKILGYIGKKLRALGTRLEERYGVEPQSDFPLNEQTISSGC